MLNYVTLSMHACFSEIRSVMRYGKNKSVEIPTDEIVHNDLNFYPNIDLWYGEREHGIGANCKVGHWGDIPFDFKKCIKNATFFLKSYVIDFWIDEFKSVFISSYLYKCYFIFQNASMATLSIIIVLFGYLLTINMPHSLQIQCCIQWYIIRSSNSSEQKLLRYTYFSFNSVTWTSFLQKSVYKGILLGWLPWQFFMLLKIIS